MLYIPVNQQSDIKTKFLDLYNKELLVVVHESIDCSNENDGFYAVGFRINQELYEGYDFFVTPNDNVLHRKIDGCFSNLKEAIMLFSSEQEATNFAVDFRLREYPQLEEFAIFKTHKDHDGDMALIKLPLDVTH